MEPVFRRLASASLQGKAPNFLNFGPVEVWQRFCSAQPSLSSNRRDSAEFFRRRMLFKTFKASIAKPVPNVSVVQLAAATARFNRSTVHGPRTTRQSPSTLNESTVKNCDTLFNWLQPFKSFQSCKEQISALRKDSLSLLRRERNGCEIPGTFSQSRKYDNVGNGSHPIGEQEQGLGKIGNGGCRIVLIFVPDVTNQVRKTA